MHVKRLRILATLALTFGAAWGLYTFREDLLPKEKTDVIALRPVAEFEPTFGIGLSEQVLSKKHGMTFLKAILDSGTRVYVFVSSEKREELDKLLRSSPLLQGADRESIVKIQLDHESMWVRDYFPIPIMSKVPHLVPTPSFIDFVYRDGNTLDDAAIHQMALAINLSVDHLPIVLDGGNFMTNGEKCVLSEEVSEDPEILLTTSAEIPLEDKLGKIFQAAMGCKKTIIVSQKPHPHVDMWMKFLDRNTLAINSIDTKDIESLPKLSQAEKEKALAMAKELDAAATLLAKDFRVVRLPMPVPSENLLLTYSNAILSNGTAIVPRYSKDLKLFKNESQPELAVWKKRLVEMESEVEAAYRKAGFEVVSIDSNEWIQDGGSFHCVSFHLPDLDAIVKEESTLNQKTESQR